MSEFFINEYKDAVQRRNNTVFSVDDHKIIHFIQYKVKENNQDNISRTKAYLHYYLNNPEVKWALLASIVSRNAGWNMTDLTLKPYKQLFSKKYRKWLFLSYERPNWLIFSDAFPQLLVYHLSKKTGEPLFYLLKAFGVSVFMEIMWEDFWKKQDEGTLCDSLIINEQHIIQHPILNEPFYRSEVFDSFIFHIQEIIRLNAVLFPDKDGELFGFPLFHFNRVNTRIQLGRSLSWLLFESPVAQGVQDFAKTIEPTGSRLDYECFSSYSSLESSLPLKECYPIITHNRSEKKEWFTGKSNSKWYKSLKEKDYHIGSRYYQKRKLLFQLAQYGSFLTRTST